MSILRFIKSLFDAEVMGEEIVNTQEALYKRGKKIYPTKDPHYWLADLYLMRNGHITGMHSGDIGIVAYSSTVLYACLSEPGNARALGLYFIYKERPDIIEKYPKFAKEYELLVKDIMELKDNNPDAFLAKYKELNPVTHENN